MFGIARALAHRHTHIRIYTEDDVLSTRRGSGFLIAIVPLVALAPVIYEARRCQRLPRIYLYLPIHACAQGEELGLYRVRRGEDRRARARVSVCVGCVRAREIRIARARARCLNITRARNANIKVSNRITACSRARTRRYIARAIEN